jgi:predicted nucleotidyltransferase
MLRDEVIAKLRAALPALRREFGVSSLFLFGSVARGDNRPDSDVDVIVEFEPTAHPTLLTLSGVMGEVERIVGRTVDVGELRSLRPAFRARVEQEMLRVA